MESWTERKLDGLKLPLDDIEVCDRSKVISKPGTTKTKDVYVDISGARYFKSRKDGGKNFIRLVSKVSKGGVYSWYESSKEANALLLDKADFFSLEKIRDPKCSYLTLSGNQTYLSSILLGEVARREDTLSSILILP